MKKKSAASRIYAKKPMRNLGKIKRNICICDYETSAYARNAHYQAIFAYLAVNIFSWHSCILKVIEEKFSHKENYIPNR